MYSWRVRLNALQTITTCTPTFWSAKVSTPKKMEWTAVHSKKTKFWHFWSGILWTPIFLEWTLSALQFFLEWTSSALQKFRSGLEVHSKTFGVDFRCTPNFWSELWVDDWLLQGSEKFWSEKVSTPNILNWTASHSKKIGVHTFSLQIGVHEVKSWSAFSLTHSWTP
jgi:hypothetical protein